MEEPAFVKLSRQPVAVKNCIAMLSQLMHNSHTRLRLMLAATSRVSDMEPNSDEFARYISTAVTAILTFPDVHMGRLWLCLSAPLVTHKDGSHCGAITPMSGHRGVPLLHSSAMGLTSWVAIQSMHGCNAAWTTMDFGISSDVRHSCAYAEELRAAVPRGVLLRGLVEAVMLRVPTAWRGALAKLLTEVSFKAAEGVCTTNASVRRILQELQMWQPVATSLGIPRSFMGSARQGFMAAMFTLVSVSNAPWVLDTRIPGDAALLRRLDAASKDSELTRPPVTTDVCVLLGLCEPELPAFTALTVVLPSGRARLDAVSVRTKALHDACNVVSIMDSVGRAVRDVSRRLGVHPLHGMTMPEVGIVGSALWPPVSVRRMSPDRAGQFADSSPRVGVTLAGTIWPRLTPPLYMHAAATVDDDGRFPRRRHGWALGATLVFAVQRVVASSTQHLPLYWTARLMTGRLDAGVGAVPPVEPIAAATGCATGHPGMARVALALVAALSDVAKAAAGLPTTKDGGVSDVFGAMKPLGAIADAVADGCPYTRDDDGTAMGLALHRETHACALRRLWAPCTAPTTVSVVDGDVTLDVQRAPWAAPALAAQATAGQGPAAITVRFPERTEAAATFPGVFSQWLSRDMVCTRAAAQWALSLCRDGAHGLGAGGTALLDRALALPIVIEACGGVAALWSADSDACMASIAVFLCPETEAAVLASARKTWTMAAWFALGRDHTPSHARPRKPFRTGDESSSSGGSVDGWVPAKRVRRQHVEPPTLPAAPRVVDRPRVAGGRPPIAATAARDGLRRAERNTEGALEASLKGKSTVPLAKLEKIKRDMSIAETLASMTTPALRARTATAAARTSNFSVAFLTASHRGNGRMTSRMTARPTARLTARTAARTAAAAATAAANGTNAVPIRERGNVLARGDRNNVHFRRNADLLLLLRVLEWRLFTGDTGRAALDAAAAAWPVDTKDAAAGVYAPCVRDDVPDRGVMPSHVWISARVKAPCGTVLPPAPIGGRWCAGGMTHALHSYHPEFLETVEAVAPVLARHMAM